MKVYSYKCETCGKEAVSPEGWRTMKAQCDGPHDRGSFQSMQQYTVERSRIRVGPTGATSHKETREDVDFCSPECAGKWVFR